MSSWNNFFLQKMGLDTQGNPWPVCESVATWGIFCKEIPFKLMEKVKEPAMRNWHDENGHDEFIPESGLYTDAYEMTVEFGCKKLNTRESSTYGVSVTDVKTKVIAFLDYLRQSGMLKMYSAHTGIGRQNVRLISVGSNATWVKQEVATTTQQPVEEEFLVFEVTFKVNDPNTQVTLSNG